MAKKKANKITDFSAAGPALGYLYQCRHALWLALGRDGEPDVAISVERFDDVAFDASGEPIQRLQLKHRRGARSSLTDTSKDLWKTLRVWSEQLASGALLLPNTLLTLVSTSTAPQGGAAALLRPGEGRDTGRALTILTRTARSSASEENVPCYKAFLALPKGARELLVEAIHVLDQSPSIVDLRPQLERSLRLAVRAQQISAFVDRLEGWWFDPLIKCLAGEVNESIPVSQVTGKIDDLREEFKQDALPIDFRDLIAPDDQGLDQRTFVQQLRLICLKDRRIARAIRDYYRAFEQRSRWVREELLIGDELSRYDDRLFDEWERQRDRHFDGVEAQGPASDEAQSVAAGCKLYDWAEHQADIFIRPACREPYVVRGSFHILAEASRIGWHPDFVARLRQVLKGAPT